MYRVRSSCVRVYKLVILSRIVSQNISLAPRLKILFISGESRHSLKIKWILAKSKKMLTSLFDLPVGIWSQLFPIGVLESAQRHSRRPVAGSLAHEEYLIE